MTNMSPQIQPHTAELRDHRDTASGASCTRSQLWSLLCALGRGRGYVLSCHLLRFFSTIWSPSSVVLLLL
jgi:hypothetical protein